MAEQSEREEQVWRDLEGGMFSGINVHIHVAVMLVHVVYT